MQIVILYFQKMVNFDRFQPKKIRLHPNMTLQITWYFFDPTFVTSVHYNRTGRYRRIISYRLYGGICQQRYKERVYGTALITPSVQTHIIHRYFPIESFKAPFMGFIWALFGHDYSRLHACNSNHYSLTYSITDL